MRIRDLNWRGEPVWPPEWWPPEHDALIGKNGVLKKVGIQKIGRQYIQIEIEIPTGPLWGAILLEDYAHLEILYQKLKDNLGRPLAEIGNLEIELFPPLPKRGLKQVRPPSTPRNLRRVSHKK